jgi:dihydrofolate reductase
MGKVKVAAFSVSLDGFGAGPNQDKENALGIGGEDLHRWIFPTKMFQKMMGKDEGTQGVDNDFAERSMENIGAWIMGRNMFGPIRGPWPNDEWKGWWGEEPPYHVPVFILTHHKRESITMKGGTTFHFVVEGIESSFEKAEKAAGGKDIRIGGGTLTIRQFLQAGLIDEMHIAFAPVFLGTGEHLFSGINLPKLGFTELQTIYGEGATHIILEKNKRANT